MILAQYIGWLLTLATVMMVVYHITKALIVLVWEQSAQFQQVGGDEAFRTMILALGDLLGLLKLRWLATGCSVAMMLTLLLMGVDGYASFGFSAITFVIAGVATPSAMQFIRPMSNFLQKARKKSD